MSVPCTNLNTSHVNVQFFYCCFASMNYIDLNTSHVNVQLGVHIKEITATKFKYISC